jgi:hypothetical protein
MKWRAGGSDFLGPRGMARIARGRKSRTDVAGARSRGREAGSPFGQTSLYRGRRWVRLSRKHMECRQAALSAVRVSTQRASQRNVVHLSRPPKRCVIPYKGTCRCQQHRRTCRRWSSQDRYRGCRRSRHSDVTPSSPSMPPTRPAKREADPSLGGQAGRRLRADTAGAR